MTKRIYEICSLVTNCISVADVGCDHGKVGLGLLKEEKCEKVIFTDISRPSLEKAKKAAVKAGVKDKCTFLCGDGLNGVPNCDTVIIAGMGGLEIIAILEKADFVPKKLVLQPMRNVVELRDYLQTSYKICRDYCFKDKKFYFLISAQPGSDSLTEEERLVGKTNVSEPTKDFFQWLNAAYAETLKYIDHKDNFTRNAVYKRLLQQGDK